MTSLIQLSSKQSSVIKRVLVALVALCVVAGGAYAVGYYKGSTNCRSIDATKARKSLESSQVASRDTAAYTLERERAATEIKQQLTEVDDACMQQTMPSGHLIDLLNR